MSIPLSVRTLDTRPPRYDSGLLFSLHEVISNDKYKVWTEVLKRFPKPEFSRAAVYARWAAQDRKNWKRDDDEVNSVSLLIAEAEGLSSLYTVAPIELPTEEGFTAVAFALPELLRQWAGRIREIALDSTCECAVDLCGVTDGFY